MTTSRTALTPSSAPPEHDPPTRAEEPGSGDEPTHGAPFLRSPSPSAPQSSPIGSQSGPKEAAISGRFRAARDGVVCTTRVCHERMRCGRARERRHVRHRRAVGHHEVLERLVLVHALERAHGVARNGHAIAADERAVGAVADADVGVLAGDDHLVDAERLQLLVEAGAVEGAVGALRRDDLAGPGCGSSSATTCAPGVPASACSPHTRSSGSDGSWASFEKTTTQSSSPRACSSRRASGSRMRSACGIGESAGDEVVEHVDDHEGLHASTFRRDREAAA